jgi:hypothetical protein
MHTVSIPAKFGFRKGIFTEKSVFKLTDNLFKAINQRVHIIMESFLGIIHLRVKGYLLYKKILELWLVPNVIFRVKVYLRDQRFSSSM